MGFPGGSAVKNLSPNAGDASDWVQSLGQENPLEKEMATHSSILAWRILWTEVPGGLQSIVLQRARIEHEQKCIYINASLCLFYLPLPLKSISPFSISACLSLPCTYFHQYHFSIHFENCSHSFFIFLN